MRLTIVFTVLGQHEMAKLAIRQAFDNCTDPETRIVVVDNGGDFSYDDVRVSVVGDGRNMGVYPVFDYAFKNVPGDILAFFHSDLIVDEKGFDVRILKEFRHDPKLGLVGFVGSDEIDANGGRGGGTTSNFQGKSYLGDVPINTPGRPGTAFAMWTGSPAEAHGKRNAGYTNAAVVDGCAMVIRRNAWATIGFRPEFPPHHFYDRLISTQMLEAKYKVAVLGIACDHLGGQTVSKEQRYPDMAQEWCEKHVQPDRYVGNPVSWDMTVYREAEFQWLREFRDRKHLVPIRV